MSAALRRLVARAEQALAGRAAPWLIAAVTGLLVLWLWGSLRPLPWVYDEAAYLLQARIFASGRWYAAGRPLPEFFEQFHVFVTPRLVPKYPPGHALFLVPGVWLGLPALVPILFSAATGGLFFAAVRRLATPLLAGVAWLVWITSPAELYIRPSYMAQTTSGLLWVLAWLALLRWRAGGRSPALIGFALAAAAAAVTRPVTAAAFLIPAGLWIVWRAARQNAWKQVALAAATALPVLALVPVWSHATTGRAFPTPYSEYSRVYAPWNLPGFGVDTTPPLRPPTPALEKFRREWLPVHEGHRPGRLPAILGERLRGIGITFFGDGPLRWLLLAALVVGIGRAGPELRFGLLSTGTLILAYLSIAARPLWTVYYLEAFPWLAAITAVGTGTIAGWLGRRLLRSRPGGTGPVPGADPHRSWTASDLASGLLLAGIALAVPGTVERLVRAREQQETMRIVPRELARAIDSIPGPAILFVLSGPAHRPYESYVVNEPDLERSRVWVVQDRGEDNRRLVAFAPERTAYTFDPGSGRVERWVP